MRVPHFFATFMSLVAMTFLFGCSREAPLKENVSLQNNHSRVYVSTSNFESPQAFLDSLANTPANNNDSLPDTLTVTINDTVYMMGVLPRHVDKIYRFQWNLTKEDGKDTVIISDNATPQAWVYSKAGVYYPLFIATDGNNATDTAGTDTKRAYIRVIDTPPTLIVPSDTLWTRHNGSISFPITARDSFGSIKNIQVDLDASGKADPKDWKYTASEDEDDVYTLTINKDTAYIDSLGNQKIYVIVEDDDGNKTKDSVHLHFNQLPKLSIISPEDGSRHYTSEGAFFFYYRATDVDNARDLRYTIWAQKSLNGKAPTTAFTDEDLIAKDYVLNMFEPRDENGNNVITLLNNPSKKLDGRIYWEMFVTDGYDTVWMNRIKTGESTSRPWTFFIGEKNSTETKLTGVAKYQGRTDHSDIRIELNDGNNIYDAVTDANGNYTITMENTGTYSLTVKSLSLKEFSTYTLNELFIEADMDMDDILLKDTVPPTLLVNNIDTLTDRNYGMTVYARDLGTYLDSVTASLDGKNLSLSSCKIKGEAVANCQLNLTGLTDGNHQLVYTAKDAAGNKTTVKQDIVVDATTMILNVNGSQKDVISSTESLVFTASVLNAEPAADSITWTWEIEGNSHTKKTAANEDGTSSITLTFDDISEAKEDVDYLMTASYKRGSVNLERQVKFGILGNNPVIMFTEPGFKTTVTLNDTINFKVKALRGQGSSSITISWNCGSGLSSGFNCPTSEDSAKLAFKEYGTHKVIATVTDDLSNTGTDTVLIEVVKDPPSIKASTQSNSNRYKIRSEINVMIDASDKYGTVQKLKWNCFNNVSGKTPILDADQEKEISPAAKSIKDSVTITLPGEETSSYTCYFKAVDDDNEESADTLVFATLLDLPTVQLATKSATVKINAVVPFKAVAHDELGTIEEYDVACSDNLGDLRNPDWTVMPGAETSVKMPSTATDNYYCVVQVKDDDGNTARDTATYKVIIGRPTVTAMLPTAYETVTIKDTIEVSAIAKDSLGTLVKYEWGCGPASSENIGFTYSSTSSPRANLVMPSTAQNNYKCIVRVTDDDGYTARDTVSINVLLAPPTVTVDNKSLTIREGFNIKLGATARDNNNVTSDPGAIVKREWSCGSPEQIMSNWKTVSDYDTVWKAPAAEAIFYCIARATDNDGNMASDTINLKFSTDLPKIWVKDELIYINIGDGFSLDATVNDVWQGINWFTWECKIKNGKSLESTVSKYSYEGNNKSFAIPKDSSYSENGESMYCIVSAEEASTKATFSDTTEVRIMEQHPEGVITAADTVYLWSGDESVDDEAIYFYSSQWGGKNSKLGELGDKNNQDFYWRFSNIGSNSFFQGNKDGSLDTSIAEFNSAFIRRQEEGSMTISLDYRDSVSSSPTYGFLKRHKAEVVSRNVYFRKAWENLAKDTVLATSKMNTAPAMQLVGSTPVVAYLESKNTIKAMALRNGSWTSIASKTTTDSVTSISLVTNGTDLFMGVLEQTGSFSVYKSTKATSDFSTVATTITGVTSPKLLYNPSTNVPVVVYIKSSDKQNYLSYLNGSSWSTKSLYSYTYTYTTGSGRSKKNYTANMKYREIAAAFTSNGNLAVVAIDTTSSYNASSILYNSSYTQQSVNRDFASNVSGMNLATAGNTLYMGFLNRDVNSYGPYVYKANVSSSAITWTTTGVHGKPIFEGYIAYHISVIATSNDVYVAIDDNGRPNLSQVHVFKLNGSKWSFFGENQLPYFSAVFYNNKGYFLRGSSPMLALDNDGKVFLSMLGRASAGGNETNNGPILMKYVADTWEIH